MIREKLLEMGEYAAAGLYEETGRGLFYRKALGLRRYFENCALSEYQGTPLYPSGITARSMGVAPHYMNGLSFHSAALREKAPTLSETLKKEFCSYHSTVPQEHSVAGNMYTHSIPHYERVLSEGLLSYIPRIEKIADADMRDGLLHLAVGIECYVARCVDYLQSVGADETLIAALKQVPMNPARNAYEAIVAWNFIMYLDNCDNLGCLGAGLLPYYRGENMIPWLENLYDNLDANGGYSMALNSECPEIAVQCLKAARGRRRPMIELFVDESTPNEVWQAAFDALRSGGQPAFYNAKPLFEGLKKRFPSIRDEDISWFCGAGCTESTIAGRSAIGSLDAGINLLLVFERSMREHLCGAESFDDFAQKVGREIELECDVLMEKCKCKSLPTYVPLISSFILPCIARGRDISCGGAKYNNYGSHGAGISTAADAMAAIREGIFERKEFTAEQLLAALDADFNGYEELQKKLLSYPKMGNNDDRADLLGCFLMERFSAYLNGKPNDKGGVYRAGTGSAMDYIRKARNVGATADGRNAYTPFGSSYSPSPNARLKGPLSNVQSFTKFDLRKICNGGPFTIEIHDTVFRNDEGERKVAQLIKTYIDLGGHQIQINAINRDVLLDAKKNPENYPNLIVRVWGWSGYFTELDTVYQDHVISRMEFGV